MTEILGYDCNGRPLRAGDRVLTLDVGTKYKEVVGLSGRVIGASDYTNFFGDTFVETDIPDPRPEGSAYLIANPEALRKLNDYHDPADADFTEWMRNLADSEQTVMRGMPWTEAG